MGCTVVVDVLITLDDLLREELDSFLPVMRAKRRVHRND
jgi:hypothetical protein